MVSENVVGCESELNGPLRCQDNHGLAGLDPCAISAARRGSEHYEECPRGNAADRISADVDQTRECPRCPGNPSVTAVMGEEVIAGEKASWDLICPDASSLVSTLEPFP